MAAITVTTSATLIHTETMGTASAPAQVFVTNNSGATVYLGRHPAVTAATGIALPTGGTWASELTLTRQVWGVVAAATSEVRVEAF